MSIFKSLVWLDPEKSHCKWDSNPGSSAPEVDALTTRPARQYSTPTQVQPVLALNRQDTHYSTHFLVTSITCPGKVGFNRNVAVPADLNTVPKGWGRLVLFFKVTGVEIGQGEVGIAMQWMVRAVALLVHQARDVVRRQGNDESLQAKCLQSLTSTVIYIYSVKSDGARATCCFWLLIFQTVQVLLFGKGSKYSLRLHLESQYFRLMFSCFYMQFCRKMFVYKM